MTKEKKLLVDLITLFPEIFGEPLRFGPLKRARERGRLEVRLWNLKEFARSPKEVDDYPYGGGSGMVLRPEPVIEALRKVKTPDSLSIYMSAQGVRFTEELARSLAAEKHIILLCGRYKGVDERVIENLDLELSIGDYVLSGGEPAALVVLDAVTRHLPGALGEKDSAETDSFSSGLLEAPQYTRPREVKGKEVPEVLLSGHHEAIRKWRRKEALKRTLLKRPDILEEASLTQEDLFLLEEIRFEILNMIERLKEKSRKSIEKEAQ